jgi:hypothetical protein
MSHTIRYAFRLWCSIYPAQRGQLRRIVGQQVLAQLVGAHRLLLIHSAAASTASSRQQMLSAFRTSPCPYFPWQRYNFFQYFVLSFGNILYFCRQK